MAVNRYDSELQMFVEGVREPKPEHLKFLRWLAERNRLEHPRADASEATNRQQIIHSRPPAQPSRGLQVRGTRQYFK